MWRAETNYGHSAHLLSFRHSRVRWRAETNYGHSAPFLSSRGSEPDDTRRQIMVIPLTFYHPDTIVSDGTQRLTSSSALFVIQRRRARWHAETNYGHSAHFLPFRHSRVQWRAETNYGHSAPFLSSRGDGLDDMRRQIMVIPLTFCHPDTIVSDGM